MRRRSAMISCCRRWRPATSCSCTGVAVPRPDSLPSRRGSRRRSHPGWPPPARRSSSRAGQARAESSGPPGRGWCASTRLPIRCWPRSPGSRWAGALPAADRSHNEGMPAPLRLALCQLNATVGDIAGNEARIRDGLDRAVGAGAQLVLFPELALTGYPPEDLLLKEHFLADAHAALERIAASTADTVALVGFPERADDVYNACAVLAGGRVQAIYRKVFLPK